MGAVEDAHRWGVSGGTRGVRDHLATNAREIHLKHTSHQEIRDLWEFSDYKNNTHTL